MKGYNLNITIKGELQNEYCVGWITKKNTIQDISPLYLDNSIQVLKYKKLNNGYFYSLVNKNEISKLNNNIIAELCELSTLLSNKIQIKDKK